MKARVERDARGRAKAHDACFQPCAIERGMRVLGGKWTGSILWHLQGQSVRFNDLARMIAGCSKKMLTDRLRQLEAQGLVSRTVHQTAPITVSYSLTEHGVTALAVLDELRRWSEAELIPVAAE